ncbi:hypothetical protein QBC33DRAFT_535328 [Phialemonium atrogriseum]|uniref:SnoaL-like domain-containing protein n=1 Tax=Phialemonium atrogriseum TaxID=1093897 RepID=A0AAJ0C1R3_9PEZI|nr:uncharacterized protein QBC33DRAFT_535328 [Phialemonium atrogriseum]KAK1768545.1 hypothetical protein QBC33DRAFT_535328 [Phialemonium atrogriseum]
MPNRRAELLEAATAFCEAFASQQPAAALLEHFAPSDDDVVVLEHGLPALAPFLGREYRGRDGAARYLADVSACVAFRDMRFGEYAVDAEAGRVAVRGSATFTWKSTGQGWEEVFAYLLAFDGDRKVVRYEIWADSGAAYLASQGKLAEAT